jgi:hypothetical protein
MTGLGLETRFICAPGVVSRELEEADILWKGACDLEGMFAERGDSGEGRAGMYCRCDE